MIRFESCKKIFSESITQIILYACIEENKKNILLFSIVFTILVVAKSHE